ncbi:hypothetical protein ACD591_09265 [Rufibacter glacialis]|uniref:Uncharacterized protein n=1 Tax=Rufibacter glacialis TaxID=1259555 RepID=A0A5M8QBF6_9BACT|nr:hypothetical protein [Rufibacter glacialis]KAA6432381.1 hypothetical protein FOE74_14850 [Rufibacter glacialis]GGK78188.1 hypothetical protein GCM10011405_27530 [Rufibacter glacialis]
MKLIDDLCIILKDPSELVDYGLGSLSQDLYVSFLIDQYNLDKIKELYKIISESQLDVKFSLTLKIGSESLLKHSPFDIAAFFFLSKYKLASGNPVVNILSINDKEYDVTFSFLDKLSKEQGFGRVICNRLTLYNYIDFTDIRNLGSEKFDEIQKIISGRDWLNESNFFLGAQLYTLKDLPEFIHEVERQEDNIVKSNPQLFKLFVLKVNLQKEVENLQSQVQYLTECLCNEKTYNKFLKENHQGKLLQEYYDHEYEILPTWFKRVGHVIKYITGKRA